jgi:hypothetical protein
MNALLFDACRCVERGALYLACWRWLRIACRVATRRREWRGPQ